MMQVNNLCLIPEASPEHKARTLPTERHKPILSQRVTLSTVSTTATLWGLDPGWSPEEALSPAMVMLDLRAESLVLWVPFVTRPARPQTYCVAFPLCPRLFLPLLSPLPNLQPHPRGEPAGSDLLMLFQLPLCSFQPRCQSHPEGLAAWQELT